MRKAQDVASEPTDLPVRIGRLLQSVRIEVGVSQERLAAASGSSQQWVSRVERGQTNARLSDVERLFVALNKHLVAQVMNRSASDDPDLLPADKAGEEVEFLAGWFGMCWRRFRDVPYLVAGRFGALCHGLPVRPRGVDLVLARGDLEEASVAMQWLGAVRWSDRNQAYTDYSGDLTAPAPLRFRTGSGFELRFAVRDELPEPVRVEIGDRIIPLLPLPDLLRTDPDVAILADRLKPRPSLSSG